MPELPEVETTRRGISPHLVDQRVSHVIVRDTRLRWPIPASLSTDLPGRRIERVERRAKYLIIGAGDGSLILHLGMSGNLRIVAADTPAGRHDHLDIVLDSGDCLRLNDPRRFGAALWTRDDPMTLPQLRSLGPEPLSSDFNGQRLYRLSRQRRIAAKNFIMDNHVVVGVGNIYANEALYSSGIDPRRAAGRISLARYLVLAEAVTSVLRAAITQGGTTLRDFVGGDGKPGYFAQQLQVYGRDGQPCERCATPIVRTVIGQRSSFFCPACQR